MEYNIINTGSDGNAIIINNIIMIDCGVSFAKLKDYYIDLKIIFLTHIHIDHFNKKTIRRLATERPTLRFAVCSWLVNELIDCGVKKSNIDVLEIGKKYEYGLFDIIPINLYHNVEQCGYRIFIDDKKIIYATDTNTLDGITARGYDLFLIEANYIEEDIKERILAKKALGIYVYEEDAMLNHLSKEKCDLFLLENMSENSRFEYMHQHRKRKEEEILENIEVLDIYTDSKGNDHVIDEMPNKMIYYAVVKYGTQALIEKGYSKLTNRFKDIMIKIDVINLMSESIEEE